MKEKQLTKFEKEYKEKQKSEIKSIAGLKSTFEEIESYSDKLTFWENNLEVFCYFYEWNEDFNGMTRVLPAHNYISENKLVHLNSLTIAPKNETEKELYNKWYFNHYQNKFYNLENAKEAFLRLVQKSKYPLELIESELKKMTPNPDLKRRLFNQAEVDKEYSDYKLKNQEPDWRNAEIEVLHRFAIIQYKVEYIYFLEGLKTSFAGSKKGNKLVSTDSFLIAFFDSDLKYHYIMNKLVELGYCEPNTMIWKDETKGNKGFLAAILKHLHKQKYYKENVRLTNLQIQMISKKTFGWHLSIDTIKKANPNNYNLSFIPPASTLP